MFGLDWTNFGEVAAIVMAISFFLWLWLRSKISDGFATKATVDDLKVVVEEKFVGLEEKIAKVEASGSRRGETFERRIAVVESRLEELPDKDSLHELALNISALGGDMKEIRAKLDPLSSTVTRIDDYLRERGR